MDSNPLYARVEIQNCTHEIAPVFPSISGLWMTCNLQGNGTSHSDKNHFERVMKILTNNINMNVPSSLQI